MSIPTFRVNGPPSERLQANAINIELWGFKDSRLVKIMAVARAIELLPAHQLEGLKKITYEEKASIPGLRGWVRLPGKSSHKGRYDSSNNSITIHLCDTRELFFHTLFHELGHFVYFRILSSFEKKRWVQETYKKEPPVTPYGNRNAAEDFAEGFALYVTGPDKLRGRAGKYAYMQNVVFRGVSVDAEAVSAIICSSLDEDDNLSLNTVV